MTKTCKICKKVYSNDVWLHEEWGCCSICYAVKIHGLKETPKIKEIREDFKKRTEGLGRWLT